VSPTSTTPSSRAPARFRKADLVMGGAAVAAIIGAALLHSTAVPGLIAAAVALSLLAALVARATEQVGHHLGPGATGSLQAAFGNLPELFVCIFSLRAGLVQVVQGALIGSILANTLLVLGIAIFVGGVKHGPQHFQARAPRMMGTLMLVVVAALAVPTLANELHTPAAGHVDALSAACAVLLLVVFCASIPFSVRSAAVPEDEADRRKPEAPAQGAWPLWMAITLLGIAGAAAALVSEWFVGTLEPALATLHVSQTFAGLVIVAVAGNAVENFVAVKLAADNRMEYALSVVLNSALQIALAVTPILILLSFVLGGPVLTLVLPPLLVAAVLLGTLLSAIIVTDGETMWLEGVALVALYGIVAASFWWG
jgi:Ca2+:H+ antiporter